MSFGKKSVIVLAILALAAASGISIKMLDRIKNPGDRDYLKLFSNVLTIVQKSYVEKVETKKLLQSAINGMLASLDPHSTYMPADSFTEMKVQMSGSFGGLGIEISMKDGKLTVIAPIEDTPAFRAGIKANDHIWKINDTFTKGLTITESVNRMRGPKGTKVTLTIIREGHPNPLVFPLIRDIIKTKSLKYKTLEPGYGYIRISQFQETTGEEFSKALLTLHKENNNALQALVIDLRNNPGGLLNQAVSVADHFIGEGFGNGLVVYTQGRDPSSKMNLTTRIGEKEPHYPIVILINGGSASASEILAGAMQDHKRAIILGTQSFGKGSVQSVLPLRDGAGLKLTTALYYTPKGRSIQAKGITPDIIVDKLNLKEAEKKKENNIREKDLEGHIQASGQEVDNPSKTTTVQKPKAELENDYQLYRAMEMLRGLNLLNKRKLN